MKKRILKFIKKEIIFIISLFMVIVSAFFVRPSAKYFAYINFDVLFILFSLMVVVSGFKANGVFQKCANLLCKKIKTLRLMTIALVMCCFFFSMLITNDVALLTFVPFTLLIFNQLNKNENVAVVIILETGAANLGSMLTPIGNPQNLFLFCQMQISACKFCKIMFPYVFASFVLLMFFCLFVKNEIIILLNDTQTQEKSLIKMKFFLYMCLFVGSLLAVLKVFPFWVLAVITFVSVFLWDKKNLAKIDYMLLLTFCAFFIFTGNVASIENVKLFLENVIKDNEFLTGVLTSQIISNVPSALLLEPFAHNKENLLIGVNVGGLGTIVASLASLISFKIFLKSKNEQTSNIKFLFIFTFINIVFLLFLALLHFFKSNS